MYKIRTLYSSHCKCNLQVNDIVLLFWSDTFVFVFCYYFFLFSFFFFKNHRPLGYTSRTPGGHREPRKVAKSKKKVLKRKRKKNKITLAHQHCKNDILARKKLRQFEIFLSLVMSLLTLLHVSAQCTDSA